MSRFLLIPALGLACVLSACGGASNPTPPLSQASSNAPAGATIPEVVTASATPMPKISLEPGVINGLDNQFSPNDGDTSVGGNGGTVDGIGCLSSMVQNKYHVHAFVGIMVNGRQMATPDAIGALQTWLGK